MTGPIRLLAALALLAACQPEPPVASPAGGDGCGASRLAGLVGQRLDAVRLPEGPEARIIGPDTIVTMDFRPDRLNVSVTEDGTIDRVYCG